MASKDVRDILGIGAADPTALPRPAKKIKKEPKQRRSGFHREVESLIGERAAPPSLVLQPGNLYRQRKQFRPTHAVTWESRRFVNQARDDGLMFRHWRKREIPIERAHDSAQRKPTEREQSGVQGFEKGSNQEIDSGLQSSQREIKKDMLPIEGEEYRFVARNYQIEKLQYTDELYNSQLKSDEWTRNETDSLVELYGDLYGKWPLIYDRWDSATATSQPVEDTQNRDTAMQVHRDRSMEDLKARYYEVAARVMAAKTPLSQMTAAQFDQYEMMLKFDTKQEAERRRVRAALLTRSLEEKREEEHLVAELRRIYLRQERFGAELKDLRERLDHTLTDSAPDAPVYQSSREIDALFHRMLAIDRNKKRASVSQTANTTSSPATTKDAAAPQSATAVSASATPATPTAAQSTPTTAGPKRGSLASATPGRRELSARDEVRFGVSSHDRLTSGVTFRSDKLLRARQVKSSTQTAKIAQVLVELRVPELLQMPTLGVCSAMEKLVQKVNLLLDTRKVREKEENELSIAKQQKALREGKEIEEESNLKDERAKFEESKGDKPATTEPGSSGGAVAVPLEPASPDIGSEGAKEADAKDANDEAETEVREEVSEVREASPNASVAVHQTRSSRSGRTKRSASVLSATSSAGSGVSKANSKRVKLTRS